MTWNVALASLAALCLFAGGRAAGASAPSPAAPTFDAAARARELDRIADLIEQHYVYKDKAAAIAKEVRALGADPELAAAADRIMWAAVLTRRLDAHDLHFDVAWMAPGDSVAPRFPAPAAGDAAAEEREAAASNYGLDEVERLPGNIGYVRLSYFAPFGHEGDGPSSARRAGEAALALIENTDAVIFDLRGNGGGSPDMIDLLLTPFFGARPVILNRFYQREGDRMVDFTTLADFKGVSRPTTPIYVLISGRTGSAAEEFAYDVQAQKRGVIVGQTSAGAANPGDRFDAGDGFSVFISTGAAVNPITGGNWERVGVKPDVPSPVADALARAQAMALDRALKANVSTAPTEARWTLETLTAEAAGARLDPARAADYVGDFGGRSVTLQDGALIYRRSPFPPQRLIPLGGDAFALEGAPTLRLSFQRDAAKRVAVLLLATADGGSASYARQDAPAR